MIDSQNVMQITQNSFFSSMVWVKRYTSSIEDGKQNIDRLQYFNKVGVDKDVKMSRNGGPLRIRRRTIIIKWKHRFHWNERDHKVSYTSSEAQSRFSPACIHLSEADWAVRQCVCVIMLGILYMDSPHCASGVFACVTFGPVDKFPFCGVERESARVLVLMLCCLALIRTNTKGLRLLNHIYIYIYINSYICHFMHLIYTHDKIFFFYCCFCHEQNLPNPKWLRVMISNNVVQSVLKDAFWQWLSHCWETARL